MLECKPVCFGPLYGIEEEAATGMAAGALACFLYKKENNIKRAQLLIEQGRFMTLTIYKGITRIRAALVN